MKSGKFIFTASEKTFVILSEAKDLISKSRFFGKKHLRMTALSLIFSFLFVLPAWAEKVRYVIDGDTFILENNLRVRMVGINAPEIDHKRYKKKGQPYGNQAKTYLKSLIDKRDVTLKNGGDDEYDRFGRRLAYVYLPDGNFVNRKMVEDGYAVAYRKFPFEYKTEFIELEKKAKAAKKGMWSGKKPVSENALLKMFGLGS